MRPVSVSLATVLLLSAACSNDKEVPTANCSTSTDTKDETECKALGARNGCEVSRVSGTGCAFEQCDSPPSCTDTPTPQDAGRD